MIGLSDEISKTLTLLHLVTQQYAKELEESYPERGGPLAMGLVTLAADAEKSLWAAYEAARPKVSKR